MSLLTKSKITIPTIDVTAPCDLETATFALG